MNNFLLRSFAPIYGQHLNTLAVIGYGLVLSMLVILVLDANTSVFLFFNRASDVTGTALWANTTMIGEGLIVLSLTGLVAVRWPAAAWAMVIGAIVGSIIVHGLKESVGALRPASMLPQGSFNIIGPRLTMSSFPSGHTATISGFATIIFLHARNRWVSASLLVLVVMVGVSRMVVGAHWPLDVLAGWLVGILYAAISVALADRWLFGLKAPTQFGIIVLSLLCAGALFWIDPYMADVMVLRWMIAATGLVSGVWALVITRQRHGKTDS